MNERSDADDHANDGRRAISRRDALKATTATAATAVGVTGFGGLASASHLELTGDYQVYHHDDYTEIQVYDDETRLWVSDGETVENVWVENNGNYFNVQALAESWTIRNFALEGLQPDHYGGAFSLAAENGTDCLMENVYLGDGGAGDWRDKHQGDGRSQPTATFTFDDHTGTITYRNIYAANWTDNTFYNGNQGGTSGTLVWENVYVEGGDISQFRIRNNDGYMYNCHATGNTHRAVWVRGSGGTMHVEDSEIEHPDNAINCDGTAELENTEYSNFTGSGSLVDNGGNGQNPDPSPPPTVPMTPEEAVFGGDDDDDDDGGESGDPPAYPVIEDFERDSPLADYGGETGLFSVTSSPTYEGNSALVNDGGDFGGGNSTSGLDTYPERGDEFEVHLNNAGDGNFAAVNFFAQSETDDPDRYAIGLSGVTDELTLWKSENGDLDTLDSSAPSDTTSGWYRIEISTDSSTISADLYDEGSGAHLASVSASDSTFSSGGIGFRSAGNGEVFDYAVHGVDDEVVEEFERSNPLTEYGGSTGQFDTTESTYEGSQALENASGDFGGVNSTSGLDTYPERGDEVHVYFDNAGDENFAAFNLFTQSETDGPDRYAIGLSGVDGEFKLWRNENGDLDTLDSSAPSDTISGWYRVEISTDASTISADLYDDSSGAHLASVSAGDSTFSSGGIGFRSAGNGEVFDYVVRQG